MVRRAGVVAAATLTSRVTGYLRDAVLANVFGASSVYDAYVIAQTIPNLLRRLVAEGSLVIAFVPLLAAEREKGGVPAMRRFTSAVLGLLIPFLILLVVLGVAFPEAVIDLFGPGFDPARASVAAQLAQVMMPYIFFISLTALAGGVLNTVGVFGPPAASQIFLNLTIITTVVMFRDRFDPSIEAVAWGIAIGGVLQLAFQVPFLRKHEMLVRPSIELRHPALETLGRRMLPSVFGVGVSQINVLVVRQIGSFLPAGQLSCYYNATRLEEFALGVFAVSVAVASLPTLSEHAAREDWGAIERDYRRAIRVTNFITVPTTVGLLVLAGPVVGVLFRHGHFRAEDAALAATLLQIMALGQVPIGIVRVTVPTFYALGDTRTPVLAALVSLATTFFLGHALAGAYQIMGLTIANELAATLQLVVLWILLRRELRKRRGGKRPADLGPGIMAHAFKCAIAMAPAGAIGWALGSMRDWYDGRNLLGLALLVPILAVVVAVYFAMAKLLKIEDADLILGVIERKIKRRRPAQPKQR